MPAALRPAGPSKAAFLRPIEDFARPRTRFRGMRALCLGCRAEVAELGDALDSKSSGALPRAGSIPAFGIRLANPYAWALHDNETDVTDRSKLGLG